MNCNNTLALLVLLFSIGYVHGQSGHPHFRNYTTADGLPSSEVYTAFEDSQGYIWFGTDNGVSRYNGYEFENFGASEGLMDNVVFHIKEDSKGRIWMNTMSGRLFYYEEGHIYAYAFNHLIDQYKGDFFVSSGFHLEEDGSLYAGLYGLGILEIDSEGNNRLLNEGCLTSAFVADFGSTVLYVIIGYQNLSVTYTTYRAQQKDLKVTYWKAGSYSDLSIEKSPQYRTAFIAQKANGKHLINLGNKLVQVDTSFQLISRCIFDQVTANITILPEEEVWIGLQKGGGIKRYKNIETICQGAATDYLKGYSISNVLRDRSGGYWLTSLENGVFYSPSLEIQVFDEQSGLKSNFIQAISPVNDTTFIFGSKIGQLYSFNTSKDQFQKFATPDQDEIHDLLYVPSTGYLWKGGTFLKYWNGQRWTYAQDDYKKDGRSIAAKKLTISHDQQTIWGSYGQGFTQVDGRSGRTIFSSSSYIPITRILAFYEAPNSQKWVGTVDGLFEFKEAALHPPPVPHPIFKIRTEAIAIRSDGFMIIGTKGSGIGLWNGAQMMTISEENGLSSNQVENIFIDSDDQIWVGTLSGLNRIRLDKNGQLERLDLFSTAHGLPSNEINDMLALGNRLWIATSKGLVSIPKEFPNNPNTYPPILQTALVNNQKTSPKKVESYPFQSNNWQFQFFSPNYKFPGKIPYRYRINPDEEWSFTTNPSINFAKLAPGNYTFEVQAQNEDQLWSESLLVPFSIKAPFWQNLSFQLLGVGILLGFVVLSFQRRLKRIQKEAQTQQEINELKRAALQAQMNPHFVFNCLNSIQQFIAIGDKRNALHYLSRFAQLIRNILQASTKTRIPLEDEVNMLSNYLELEKARFGNKFDYEINLDPKIDGFESEIPPLLIQPYVENAIIHGIANLDQRGKINISYTLQGVDLKVSVSDNGVGIYQTQNTKRETNPKKKSLGMNITLKRLRLVQAVDTHNEPVSIIERTDDNGKVVGTTIEILLQGWDLPTL